MPRYPVEEALLREPNLWVPGKKPVGPVKIDWSLPITNGLKFYVLVDGVTAIDLVTNAIPTAIGSLATFTNWQGRGFRKNEAGTGFEFPYNPNWDINSSDFSVGMILNNFNPYSGNRYFMGFDDTTLIDGHWFFGTTQYQRPFFSTYDGLALADAGGELGTIVANDYCSLYGYARSGSTTHKFYNPIFHRLDVRVYGVAAHSTSSAGSGILKVGSSTQPWQTAEIFVAFGYDRSVLEHEWVSLDADPYQFLIPA